MELPAILLLLFQCDRITRLDLHVLAHVAMQSFSSIQPNEFESLTFGLTPVFQFSDRCNFGIPSNHPVHLTVVQCFLRLQTFLQHIEQIPCYW